MGRPAACIMPLMNYYCRNGRKKSWLATHIIWPEGKQHHQCESSAHDAKVVYDIKRAIELSQFKHKEILMKQITNVLAWAKTRPPSTTESGASSYDSASMVGDPEVDMEDENPPVYVPNALGRALVVGFDRFLYVVNSVRFGHTFMVADSIHKDVEGAMRQMKDFS